MTDREPSVRAGPKPLLGVVRTGSRLAPPVPGAGLQIKLGAPPGAGTMQGFADRLGDEQILDTIAWFQGPLAGLDRIASA